VGEAIQLVRNLRNNQEQARSARGLQRLQSEAIPQLQIPEETKRDIIRNIYASIPIGKPEKISLGATPEAGSGVVPQVRRPEEPAAVGQEAPAKEEGKVTPAPDIAAIKAELAKLPTEKLREQAELGADVEHDAIIYEILGERGANKPIDWLPNKGEVVDIYKGPQGVPVESTTKTEITVVTPQGLTTYPRGSVWKSEVKAPPAPAPIPAPEAPTPAPAPEVAKQDAKRTRIGEKITELHTTNTGEDSREFVAGQAAGMTNLARRYSGMEAVLRSAVQRIDTAMQTMPDKPVDLLTADEVISLAELDDAKTTQSAGIAELLQHKKKNTLNRGLLISWANRVRSESISAENRLNRLTEKSGLIDPKGKEPLTPNQLVNPYAINYNPQKKGDTPPPAGYFEMNGSGGEWATEALAAYDRATTDEAREAAARKLGDELLVGSRVGTNRALTKRLVAWQAPDGSVSVLAGRDQSQKRAGKDATANQAWRFTIGPTDRKKKGDIEGGNVGIDTLLKAGYRPIEWCK